MGGIMFHIVMHEPEIPYNTGNIARTCVLTNTALHLIRPLGFQLDEKKIKRAGMDYWPLVNIKLHDSFEIFLEQEQPERIFMATTKANHRYDQAEYKDGDYIMFGKESRGIPEDILAEYHNMTIRIPMEDTMGRSLNVCNSVNVILYEALKQNNFPGLR